MFEQPLEALKTWIKEQNEPETNRLDVIIDAADLIPAVQALLTTKWGYLSAITGLDRAPKVNELEVLYHFCEKAAVLTLRVRLPRDTPAVQSLCEILPGARLYEQEVREMFGIEMIGLAANGYLFLPDDWQEGVYPLRRDATIG
jgi:NADH-quinone oxidoreductase subunit C